MTYVPPGNPNAMEGYPYDGADSSPHSSRARGLCIHGVDLYLELCSEGCEISSPQSDPRIEWAGTLEGHIILNIDEPYKTPALRALAGLVEQLETQRFAFTSEWRTRAEQAEATLAFQQQATAELEEQLEAAQKELRSALDDFGYDRSRTELKEQLETAQRDNERKEVWILGARDRLEQLETLRETAWAACNATSYVTDDGRVITADVALEERVSDLRRALSNPASEPKEEA